MVDNLFLYGGFQIIFFVNLLFEIIILKLTKMKRLIIGIFVLGLLFPACNSRKQMALGDYEVGTEEAKIYSAPAAAAAPSYQPPVTTQGSPVSARTESFTFAQQSDASGYQGSYFVIVGSFSSYENANRFKSELIPQGFNPVVLQSESGYYRVCVNSFNDEGSARQRVYQIRSQYPKYSDTWLLIRR